MALDTMATLVYNGDMNKKGSPDDWKMLKVWGRTHRTARIIAALRGESLANCIDRLLEAELARLTNASAAPDDQAEKRGA